MRFELIMKKYLSNIVVVVATFLAINMIQTYYTQETAAFDMVDDIQEQFDMSFSLPKGEMTTPYLQNSIPAPHVQFSSLKKIHELTNNTVILKRLPINLKFFGPKISPQSSYCFATPNDFFVVMLRHLRI